MFKLFGLIFHGCWHTYEDIGSGDVVDGHGATVGMWYKRRCTKCCRRTYKQIY